MKQEYTTEKKIEQVMQSLDGIQRAEAPPFLYTRIEAALDGIEEGPRMLQWVTRPSFAVFGFVIVIMMNAMVLYNHFQESSTTSNVSDEQLLSQEYGLSNTDEIMYPVNDDQP